MEANNLHKFMGKEIDILTSEEQALDTALTAWNQEIIKIQEEKSRVEQLEHIIQQVRENIRQLDLLTLAHIGEINKGNQGYADKVVEEFVKTTTLFKTLQRVFHAFEEELKNIRDSEIKENSLTRTIQKEHEQLTKTFKKSASALFGDKWSFESDQTSLKEQLLKLFPPKR